MNELRQVAEMVKKAGAAGSSDTVLAHITPKEAAMLKARGGSGRIDPHTGLPHFEDDGDSSSGSYYSGSSGGDSGYSGNGDQSTHSDPSYNAKGYYSAAGGYLGGEEADANPTRYYSDRRTIGGDIANYFGFDPEGWGARIGNGLIGAAGNINPMLGLAGKAAQAYVGAQSVPHLADMNGEGGSMNALGRLVAGDSDTLKSAMSSIPMFQALPNNAAAPTQIAQLERQDGGSSSGQSSGGSRSSSVQDIYADLLKRRRAAMA